MAMKNNLGGALLLWVVSFRLFVSFSVRLCFYLFCFLVFVSFLCRFVLAVSFR